MDTKLYTFSSIFKSGEVDQIVIPKIQRDYAQGRRGAAVERMRAKFLDALYDAVIGTPIKLDFIYGDIENKIFIPLDGQQRLTTLFLLHWYAAKKDKIDATRCEYLGKFRYDTRPSAQDFCHGLVEFKPKLDPNTKLSDEIIDASWFPLDYLNDPTVSSMLVMLDAIDGKFKSVDGLFDKLESGAIGFYFSPIKNMGLTDELYIKMNSRGKPLTLFEHFKAELLRELKLVDGKLADDFAGKLDRIWTDLLWKYCNTHDERTDNDNIDDSFLRYFRFVCDMICYGNGESVDDRRTAVGRNNDVFALIKSYFSKDNPDAQKNARILEKYFDIWCGIDDIKEFFGRFLSKSHAAGKIKYDGAPDLFEECISGYADVSDISAKERKLPLPKAARLFTFVLYLSEKADKNIGEADFRRRLRIIDNLIKNSRYEVVDSPNSDSGNRMPKILKLIRDILTGKALKDCDNALGFNPTQFNEEVDKEKWLIGNPSQAEALFKLEDHAILNGQMGVVDLVKPERFSRFEALFECDRDAVNCALLAIGDFSQLHGRKLRLGGRSECGDTPWIDIFHRSKYEKFETTQDILWKLLDNYAVPTDSILRSISDDYIKKCEQESLFDWRYYFIKYECFRPKAIANCKNEKSYGGYYGYGKYRRFSGPYDIVATGTDKRLTNYSYKPFLTAIGEGVSDAEDPYNITLRLRGYTVTANNDGYEIIAKDGSVAMNIRVPQNNGIDITDRIELIKDKIKNI